MRFKKYSGYINSAKNDCKKATIFFTALGVVALFMSGFDYKLWMFIMLICLPASLICAQLMCSIYIHGEKKSHRDDTIVLDENGVGLERKRGENLFIPWEEVMEVVFSPSSDKDNKTTIVIIKGFGRSIGWAAFDESSQEYILQNHPELTIKNINRRISKNGK